MLKQLVRMVLACLLFACPCLSQTGKANPSTDDSAQDRVCLSEILIGSKSDTPAQVTEAQHKAEGLRKAAQKRVVRLPVSPKQTPEGPRQHKGEHLDVSSGVNWPRNLKSVCFACSSVKYRMCCIRNKVG